MQSGRVGTIDLDQPADAVAALRELLRSQGATPENEDAPGAVGAASEGGTNESMRRRRT